MFKILTHFTIIDKMFELTFGQGHKVKGQGLINTCVNFFASVRVPVRVAAAYPTHRTAPCYA